MKLGTPNPTVRLVIDLHEVRVVLAGVFPPEAAPSVRLNAQAAVNSVAPALIRAGREAAESFADDMARRVLYGDARPGSKPPIGVLHAKSVVATNVIPRR